MMKFPTSVFVLHSQFIIEFTMMIFKVIWEVPSNVPTLVYD